MIVERMVGFGYKSGWLAVRDGSLAEVVRVLGGELVGTDSWRAGIDRAYLGDTVAVTPLLPDARGGRWLLVTGRWIGMNSAAVDAAELSEGLGSEVQIFITHRVVEFHRWDRAVDGVVVRSFEYVGDRGQVTRWRGQPTEVELGIGLPADLEIGVAAVVDGPDLLVSEHDVMKVAAEWSLDPTTLDGQPATARLSLVRFPVSDG